MRILRTILLFGALAVLPLPALAGDPLTSAFTYQGQLRDAGNPAGGLHDLRFRLYDALEGGGQVGATFCADDVSVTDGLFTVSLDFGAEFAGEQRFLEVEVRADTGLDCTDPTGFATLAPRQALTATPYALGLALPLVQTTATSSDAFNVTNTGTGDGLQSNISNPASNGEALKGSTNGTGDSVHGINTGTGRAAFFQIDNAANTESALLAQTDGSGRAVFGLATAAGGGTYGVFGQSNSTDGRGVYGLATAATGGGAYGVFGQSNSTDGRGVYGLATAATGNNYGGRFESSSTSGIGVFGWAYAGSGTVYGVFGQGSVAPGGYGVYAAGDMGASGTKPFRIDHPDDPANQYLLHYAAESPEVINFYSGKATLDAAGEAVVELPHYFARINKDPRYTLTAVGAPMPMLHVAEEIDEATLSAGATAEPGEAAPTCSFRIAGGAPGAKVSWRVEALRNDRWVRQRGAPVVVEKEGLEKGTYQHPELYGQPVELGMNYIPERERPLAERRVPPPVPDSELAPSPDALDIEEPSSLDESDDATLPPPEASAAPR